MRSGFECTRAIVRRLFELGLVSGCLMGCGRPPASQFPSAQSALNRMRTSQSCSRGIQSEAKIDYFAGSERVRGQAAILTSLPDRIRIEAFSSFGVAVSTLTSDGSQFELYDLRQRTFMVGPAEPCNMARFTHVPLPAFALVQLLRGEAPVIVHSASAATLSWKSSWFGTGAYVVDIAGQNESHERIRLVPHPDDFSLPFDQQRIRVLDVTVDQQGIELYRVELDDYARAVTSGARLDPDGLDPPIPPSGPPCSAEIPRSVRLTIPDGQSDVVLHLHRVFHNPPLIPGVFRQNQPAGVRRSRATCGN